MRHGMDDFAKDFRPAAMNEPVERFRCTNNTLTMNIISMHIYYSFQIFTKWN